MLDHFVYYNCWFVVDSVTESPTPSLLNIHMGEILLSYILINYPTLFDHSWIKLGIKCWKTKIKTLKFRRKYILVLCQSKFKSQK